MVESSSGGGGFGGFFGNGGKGSGGKGSGGNDGWNWRNLIKTSDFSDKTRAHLVRVYNSLAMSTVSCAIGMYLNSTLLINGIFMTIAAIMLSVYFIYQVYNPRNSSDLQIGFLLAFAFLSGYELGPAMHNIAEVQPQLLQQAVVYTGGAFTSFSAVSLFSERRSMLFLGGIAITMMQAMAVYAMFNWFLGSGALGLPFVLLQLFVTSIWIVVDTQIIVEQSERGVRHVAGHALMLFQDLLKMFIQILKILLEMNQDDKDKKRRR